MTKREKEKKNQDMSRRYQRRAASQGYCVYDVKEEMRVEPIRYGRIRNEESRPAENPVALTRQLKRGLSMMQRKPLQARAAAQPCDARQTTVRKMVCGM